jgi:hypothetical protein
LLCRGSTAGGVPPPDDSITKLEDAWIKKHGDNFKDASFPFRPRFGTAGVPVVLWANYFKLNPNPKIDCLWKYDVRVLSKKKSKAEEEAQAQKTEPQKTEPRKTGPQKTQQRGDKPEQEVRGKKLAKVIQRALQTLPGNPIVATEYKQQVVSLKELQLPADRHVQVELNEPGRRNETWFVRFDGPVTMDLGALAKYLTTMDDPANDDTFPKFPDELDGLAVVLGHTARSDTNASVVGRNRFFAIDNARREVATMKGGSFVEILRGYIQSVRPATGRLLLNTNVTAGVFRMAGPLKDLCGGWYLTDLHQNATARNKQGDLRKLNKFLARSRLRCRIRDDKTGEWIVVERTTAGLATSGDGKDIEKKPIFAQKDIFEFGTPATVKFFLNAPETPDAKPPKGLNFNAYVSVLDYFKFSKCFSSRRIANHRRCD